MTLYTHVVHIILQSKEILKRIERRELYKYVGVALYPPSNGEKQEVISGQDMCFQPAILCFILCPRLYLVPRQAVSSLQEGSTYQEQLQLCESFKQIYPRSDDDILTDVKGLHSYSWKSCMTYICAYVVFYLMQDVVFRFGTKSTPNPVDEVPFYSKLDPNRTIPIKKDQVGYPLHAWLFISLEPRLPFLFFCFVSKKAAWERLGTRLAY